MQYTSQDVQSFVAEEDVRFIHLAFCDVFGRQKNIAILPSELPRAFSYGIAIDASAIRGFGGQVHSDLFLHPLPQTLKLLPWRPEQGKLVQMQCKVSCPVGSPFENDTRSLLIRAVEEQGVFALEKPTTPRTLETAIHWMFTARQRLRRLEQKTQSLKEKMQEIRYDCIGALKIAEALPIPVPSITMNTRRGVFVNYVPSIAAVRESFSRPVFGQKIPNFLQPIRYCISISGMNTGKRNCPTAV